MPEKDSIHPGDFPDPNRKALADRRHPSGDAAAERRGIRCPGQICGSLLLPEAGVVRVCRNSARRNARPERTLTTPSAESCLTGPFGHDKNEAQVGVAIPGP